MNIKLSSYILLAAIFAAGCVRTVDNRKTAAVPFVRDRIEGRYERTVAQVYDAALFVIRSNKGTLENETVLHNQSDQVPVRTMEARVNNRRIWIRVEPVDDKVTSVVVQARTSAGGTDMTLAYELEKQIAVQLVNK